MNLITKVGEQLPELQSNVSVAIASYGFRKRLNNSTKFGTFNCTKFADAAGLQELVTSTKSTFIEQEDYTMGKFPLK